MGYYELFDHFEGNCPLEYAIEQVKIHSRRLAKHQRTWMRRLDGVHWVDVADGDKLEEILQRTLAIIEQQ